MHVLCTKVKKFLHVMTANSL